MKQFKNIIFAIVTILFAACSDSLERGFENNSIKQLTITVMDKGYVSNDRTDTRTDISPFKTKFKDGQKAGLFIVRDGKVILSNEPITAKVDSIGNIQWEGLNDYNHHPDNTYFLYYPYDKDYRRKSDIFTTTSTDNLDSQFFQDLITTYNPNPRYRDKVKTEVDDNGVNVLNYDLMTSQGIITSNDKEQDSYFLIFSMNHQLSMVTIEVPTITYKFVGTSIPDFSTLKPQGEFFFNSGNTIDESVSLVVSNGNLKFLVNPNNKSDYFVPIKYSYINTRGQKCETIINSEDIDRKKLKKGHYTTYKIDGAKHIVKQYKLQVGDILYNTKDDSDWYIIPVEQPYFQDYEKATGVVFYVGDKMISDNYGILKKENFKDGQIHGLVAARTRLMERFGYYQELRIFSGPWGTMSYINNWLKNSVWANGVERPKDFRSLADTTQLQGYINTLALNEYLVQKKEYGYSSKILSGMKEFSLNGGPKAPNNTSNWYLPSYKEEQLIYSTGHFWNVKWDITIPPSSLTPEWTSSVAVEGKQGLFYPNDSISSKYNTGKVRPILIF